MKKNSVLRAIVYICFFLFVFLQSVLSVSFYNGYYHNAYEKTALYEELNVSKEDLNKSIDHLLSYLEGNEESIDVTITINGNERLAFNEKEKLHMVDVYVLANRARMVRTVSLILGVLIIGYLKVTLKKDAFYYIAAGFKHALYSLLFFFVFLAGWIIFGFSSFWTVFHQLVFSNDLWLLNPNTDFMIQMLPESVFMGLVLRICAVFVGTLGAIFGLNQLWIRQKNKNFEGISNNKVKEE